MTINSTLTGVVLTSYRRNIKYIIYNIPQEIDKMGLFEAVAVVVPLFSVCIFLSLSFPLSSCLDCIPLLVGLPSLRSLLTEDVFLVLRELCGCFLFVSSVFAFGCVYLFYFFLSSVSLPGDDVLCWLLSYPLPSVCFSLFFFSGRVPGLIWSGSVYLATTAGFVADQLM